MITLEQIRKNFQQELKECGLTQSEIAKRLNLSKQTVSCYMHGKKLPALDTFANLCKQLDIDPMHILCLNEWFFVTCVVYLGGSSDIGIIEIQKDLSQGKKIIEFIQSNVI